MLREIPRLLSITSSRPKRLAAACTTPRTSSTTATSTCRNQARDPQSLVTVVVVEIRDDHFGPGIHESFDYSTTEARGTAGGDGDFSGQRGGHRLSRSDRAASGDTGGEDAVAEAATGQARRVK